MQTEKGILIIDDNELFSSALKSLLEYEGFEVETCACAVSALGMAEERQFDVYIIDYRLQGVNGDAVAAAIRRIQPSAMIIGCSAESKEQAFLRAGADKFIPKQEMPGEVSSFIRQ